MATDAYMFFQDYKSSYLQSESQVDLAGATGELASPITAALSAKGVFEIEDYSFDIEQTLNIGSQSQGAGAGKVTFNPFSITRKIDKASPLLFQMACSGTAFQSVVLGLRKGAGGETAGQFFLRFDFKLVAVKTISWAHDEESPKETVTFEYGGLQVRYGIQEPSGKITTVIPGGWNRVKNIADTSSTPIS
jgi:type VI secretion system Hcp family effector